MRRAEQHEVGLAREEFIISSAIQVHPLALVHFDTLPAGPAKDKIAQLTRAYAHKPDYFVDRLAEGVGQIAAAFYPKDVNVARSPAPNTTTTTETRLTRA